MPSRIDSGCLFRGRWQPGTVAPLYYHRCPLIKGVWECGAAAAAEAEHWEWRPECTAPPLNADWLADFSLLHPVAFAGDSLSLNTWQGLGCALGSRRHRVTFLEPKDHWLADALSPSAQPSPPVASANLSSAESLARRIERHRVDVVVLSVGYWFLMPHLRFLYPNGSVLPGGYEAFGLAIRALRSSLERRRFGGLVLWLSTPPRHFVGGDWDSGGVCGVTAAPVGTTKMPTAAMGAAAAPTPLALQPSAAVQRWGTTQPTAREALAFAAAADDAWRGTSLRFTTIDIVGAAGVSN